MENMKWGRYQENWKYGKFEKYKNRGMENLENVNDDDKNKRGSIVGGGGGGGKSPQGYTME